VQSFIAITTTVVVPIRSLEPYPLQRLRPSKLLSIIVRNFAEVSQYTLGFAVSNVPGQVSGFPLAKQLLPGPVRLHEKDMCRAVVRMRLLDRLCLSCVR
jgi:hypothetical protein